MYILKYTKAWKTTWSGIKYPNCQAVVQGTASSLLWGQPWYMLPKYPIYLPGILLERPCVHLICLTRNIWEHHRRAVIVMHLAGPYSREGQTPICTDTYHSPRMPHLACTEAYSRPHQFMGLHSHSLDKRQIWVWVQAWVPKYKANIVSRTQVSIGIRYELWFKVGFIT